jgi:cell division septation protein DedD
MSGKALRIQANMKYTVILVAGLGLAACDENGEFQMPSFGGTSAAGEQGTAPSLAAIGGNSVERDVEAPDVFSVTDTGLWDGRPSLGGVWVAHPDVTDPERVIIRNQANGQFVIGALFRRERENPGPSLQVSSDAAEALGLLAGAPTQLSVIALRREEGPAEAEVTDPVAAVALETPAAVTATPLDGDVVEDVAATATDITPAPTSDVANAAAAAIAAAAATAEPAAPAPPASAPAPAPVSTLEKPFIQIGIFSVEANANATADRLRADGLSSRVLAQNSQGRSFWRVLVGPAPNATDRAAVLNKVKGLGFTDAYFVTN